MFKFNIPKINLTNKEKVFYISFISFSIILIFIIADIASKQINKKQSQITYNLVSNKDFSNLKKFVFKKIESPFVSIKYLIKKGDTLGKILKGQKINNQDIGKTIQLFKSHNKKSSILAGNDLELVFKKSNSMQKNSLQKIVIPITKSINIEIFRDESGGLVSEKIINRLFKKTRLVENKIENSLYASATAAKMNPDVIVEFARIFGFEIDFQRDIRKNDRFQVLFESYYDDNDEYVKSGSIIYAFMSVNNREISLYKFGDDEGYGYFDPNGKSVEKALMKTPINGARLSSPFGLRKHPILGYNKQHNGTDFAAPSGTPIMASGSGVVVLAKWCGGGGNCIKIKHNSTYQTVYAHMKSFARGMKAGKKVRQGEIIGYVGSTGMSTGPHLHYEVIVNGKKVNSQKLKLPSGKVLKSKERQDFEIHRIKTDVLIAEMLERNIN